MTPAIRTRIVENVIASQDARYAYDRHAMWRPYRPDRLSRAATLVWRFIYRGGVTRRALLEGLVQLGYTTSSFRGEVIRRCSYDTAYRLGFTAITDLVQED